MRRSDVDLTLAADEMIRWASPVQNMARTATRDVEVRGQQVQEGDQLMLFYPSANRDEAEFACPHAFDLSRTSNRHLAFGAGPHRCAGSNLARMNLRIAFEELVQRVQDVRLQPGAEVAYHSAMNRAPVAVPITFTPGPRSASA